MLQKSDFSYRLILTSFPYWRQVNCDSSPQAIAYLWIKIECLRFGKDLLKPDNWFIVNENCQKLSSQNFVGSRYEHIYRLSLTTRSFPFSMPPLLNLQKKSAANNREG